MKINTEIAVFGTILTLITGGLIYASLRGRAAGQEELYQWDGIKAPEATQEATAPIPEPCHLSVVECGEVVVARITQYGWTGNKTASGKWPEIGMVATSDRTIPFGTRVIIDGTEYVVEDRTANWVHEKFDYPTFDIYSENPFGMKITEVELL